MVTFAYGSTSLTIRPPEFSDIDEYEYVQARGRTHDGRLLVGDKAITLRRLNLQWRALSDTVQAQLVSFFSSSNVNGSYNTFYYTNYDSRQYVVRLVNGSLNWMNYYTNLWQVDMVLEIISEVTGS